MFSPLELMYFMAAGHESNKRKERENRVTTYAMHEGKVITYDSDGEAPEGAKPFATKIGNNIVNLPKAEKPAEGKPYEVDVFSRSAEHLPETKLFAEDDVGAMPREGWSQYFIMSGLKDRSPEYIKAMAGLQRVGRGNRMPNGSIEDIQFMPAYYKGLVEDDVKPVAPVEVEPSLAFARVIAKGEQMDYYYGGQEDMKALQKRVQSLKEDGTDFDIMTGTQKTLMIGGKEQKQFVFSSEGNNQLMTALGVKAASESTGGFASAPIKWNADGKEQTFTPSSKSEFMYDTDMSNFIRDKVGQISEGRSEFDWTTMSAGSLDIIYNYMYNDILQKESQKAGILDPERGLILQPDLLMSVSEYAYPTYFTVGNRFDEEGSTAAGDSFYKYFYSRARNMAAEEITRLGKKIGAREGSPLLNASFIVPLENGTAVGIPQFISEDKHKSAFTALLQWSANSGFSENASRSRVGNAVRSYPSVFGDPASPLAAAPTQYGLRTLAQLSTNPSSNSVAGNVLRNATLAYDPAVPGYEANAKELEQVATVVMGASPQARLLADGRIVNESVHPTFNDKLALVSVFSPQLEDRSADLDTFYRVNDFKNKTFKGKRFDDMQAEEAAIARSSLEASRLLTEAMSQIFIIKRGEDGLLTYERTPFGQRAGEALLTLSSFMENVKAGIRVGLGGIAKDNAVIAGALSLFSSTEKVVNAIDSGSPDVGTMVQDQFGKFGRATSSYYNPGQSQETFQAKEAEARKKRIADLAEIERQMVSTNSITANAARRRYLNYVIAYSVASALQGGTGGRTISDQDVQNVLNFLNGGMSTPENEYAVMGLLRDDLMYRAQRGAALSNKNNQVVLNAMILTDLETKTGFSVEENLRNRIEFVDGENVSTLNPPRDEVPAGPRIPEAQQADFLKSVNLLIRNDGSIKDDDGAVLSFSSFDEFMTSDKLPQAAKEQYMLLFETRVKK